MQFFRQTNGREINIFVTAKKEKTLSGKEKWLNSLNRMIHLCCGTGMMDVPHD